MKKLKEDLLFEHGEYSIKRVLALAAFCIISFLVIHRAVTKGFTPEGFNNIITAYLFFIGSAIGLAMINKMKHFNQSTNQTKLDPDEPT